MVKHLRWSALLAVLVLVLAACSTGGTASPSTAESMTESAAPSGGGGSAAETCDADEFGCVEVAEGDPIVLGTALVITGPDASLGLDSQYGAQVAVNLRNNDGGVLGHDVELNNQDDGCSSDGGTSAANLLRSIPEIVAVIGTSCSSAGVPAAQILSEAGILLVSPSNTAPSLTDPATHEPFYARTAHNDKIQGAIVSDFVYTEKGITTAATINDESPYADGLAEAFRNNFEAAGGSITSVEAINSGDTDFKPLLTSIAEKNPGALYFPDFNPACALIAKQAADIMPDTLLIGSDGCLATDFLQTAGSAANGVFASSPDLSVFANGDFYKNEFIPAYKTEFGTAPTSVFHAHAFDAMNILFEAIKTAAVQNSDGSLTIPRQALRDAIFATSGWDGITGTITCNELGDCATDVTIGIFEAPGWPVEGGSGNQDPVFSETKTLDDVL